MRILQLITRDNNRSGSGVQMMQLSLELARWGHDVTAVYNYNQERNDDFTPYLNSKVDLHRINFKNTELKANSLSDVMKIRALIKGGNFDIVHCHSSAADHAFLATLGMNIPVVANRGMCSPLKWKNSLKYKSSGISHIIAVSENVKDVMISTGGVPREKISVIYGSVDVNRFHPNISTTVTREKLGIDDNAFVIGYTGSIGGRKGIDYFINAFREVVKNKPECILLLIGISEQQLKQHDIQIEAELKPQIKCLGFQHHPEHYMMHYDLFVFPGTKGEGLTGAIREAAAMKIPVVTTDVGGNKELIRHKKCGLIVPPKNSSALANAICWMIDNHNYALEMANNAHDFVHENMTLKARTDKVIDLYKQLIS